MTIDERSNPRMARLFRLLAERLEGYVEGEDLAFETLGERLEEEAFTADEIQSAAWVLRGLADPEFSAVAPDSAPGKNAQRVLSAAERTSVSPEAWGYLLELQRHGSLDAGQVERVLDLLKESGVRPIDVELTREIAARVALLDERVPGDVANGEVDLIH
jgi:uncharacterized protein Smg (DUF494 family)